MIEIFNRRHQEDSICKQNPEEQNKHQISFGACWEPFWICEGVAHPLTMAFYFSLIERRQFRLNINELSLFTTCMQWRV